MTGGMRDRALAVFASDLEAITIVELTQDLTAEALGLLRRHQLRTSDAIQLASCLCLPEQIGGAVSFVAFDRRLTDAARLGGLKIQPAHRR